MTGPEHYREAERDLDAACRASDKGRNEDAVFWHQSAQVHATLALAAATAVSDHGVMPVPDADAWITAASAWEPPVKVNGGAA